MKKFSLLFLLVIVTNYVSRAQCVPNKAGLPTTKQYIVPDSATGLGPACVGKPYEEYVYIKIFKDSIANVSLFGTTVQARFAIDSFIINLDPVAIGLPSYLSIQSVPDTQTANTKHNFPHLKLAPVLGDTLACLKISGNVPANATVGPIPLSITFIGFADAYVPPASPAALINDTAITTTLSSYKIDVQSAANCTQGVTDYLSEVKDIYATPNPATNKIAIGLNTTKAATYDISIMSMTGALVAVKEMNTQPGINSIDFDISALPAGLYVYKVAQAGNFVSGKFSKE